MGALHRILSLLDKLKPAKIVYAHCDIPCGIYDPHLAQMAAHTVIRMTSLISETTDAHKIARLTAMKEEHAELCKKELRILWGDYFKHEHVEKYPELHELVWVAMKLCSQAKQEINMKAAEDLLETVNKIAGIFWQTKGIETATAKAPYPTKKETVYPKL